MYYAKIINGAIYLFRTHDDELITSYDTLGEFLKQHYRKKLLTQDQINAIANEWISGVTN